MTKEHESGNKSGNGRGYKISLKRAKMAGIAALLLVCIVIFLMSPIFKIKTIEVNVNSSAKSSEIINTLGFSKGDNIFSVDVEKAKQNIKKLDRVDNCEIQRTLPGKVTVTVTEKNESGYIKISAGYAGVDENGKVMKVTKVKEKRAPVINGIKISEPKKNDYIKSEDKKGKQKTETVIRILSALKEHGITEKVETIDINNLKEVTIVLTTGTIVYFGEDGKDNDDKLEYKIAFLKAILEEGSLKGGGSIDLTNTDNVRSTMS